MTARLRGFHRWLVHEDALPLMLAAVLLLVLPAVPNRLILDILVLIGIYTIVCLGLSLIFGYAGQLSLTQAAFYGIGAYTSAILTRKLGLPFWVGFLGAGALSAAVAYALGAPLLRLRHFYLAMATLAFGEVVGVFFVQQISITGGPTGIVNVPFARLGPVLLDETWKYYYFVLLVAALAFLFSRNLVRSKIGRALVAIGSTEIGAAAMGVNVTRYKLLMFALSGLYAGLAGSLYAHYLTFVGPDSFTTDFSILLVVMIGVGGIHTLWGAVLGAVFAATAPTLLSSYREYSMLLYGVLLVVLMMFLPEGLGGVLQRLGNRAGLGRAAVPEATAPGLESGRLW